MNSKNKTIKDEDWTNCFISTYPDEDFEFAKQKHILLGGAKDKDGKEVHIWIKRESLIKFINENVKIITRF